MSVVNAAHEDETRPTKGFPTGEMWRSTRKSKVSFEGRLGIALTGFEPIGTRSLPTLIRASMVDAPPMAVHNEFPCSLSDENGSRASAATEEAQSQGERASGFVAWQRSFEVIAVICGLTSAASRPSLRFRQW